MSFSRNNYEYMRPDASANWLKEFADRELEKGGNFDDIKNLFKVKEDRHGVEARVKELRDRIGLDAVLGQTGRDESQSEKSGSAKLSRGSQEGEYGEDEPTQPNAVDIHRHQGIFANMLQSYESDAVFRTALDAEFVEAKKKEPNLTFIKYVDRMITHLVNEEMQNEVDDKLPGGLADGRPDSDFDKKQLEKGIKVEKEHTPDKAIRKEISKDHLTEHEKYYDFLENMETKMEKDKKSKAEIINTLVLLANALEDEGDFVGANIMDKHIRKVAKEAKEEASIPEVLKKHPKAKIFIDNLCKSREGHIDFPAILKMLRDERREEIDVHDDDLGKYIKQRLKEEKKELPDMGDELAGMGYAVFVVTEGDDGNDEIFHTPAPKR
jgi:hypothetical protein